jgi:hypothetical protein
VQIGPAVASMKLAASTIKPFRAKCLVEAVGRVFGLAEQQHRSHAKFHEPPRGRAEKEPPETLTLDSLEQVNLVKFASVSWNPAVMWSSLSKAHQLAAIVFDDVTKPTTIQAIERFAPLSFPKFIRRTAGPATPMRLIERFDVQSHQRRNIGLAGFTEIKRNTAFGVHGCCFMLSDLERGSYREDRT